MKIKEIQALSDKLERQLEKVRETAWQLSHSLYDLTHKATDENAKVLETFRNKLGNGIDSEFFLLCDIGIAVNKLKD